MSEDLPAYNLLKCADCSRHFGCGRLSKPICRFCGSSSTQIDVIARTTDAEELQRLVSEHNIPQELSEQFSKLNPESEPTGSQRSLEPEQAQNALRSASDEQGRLTLESIRTALRRTGSTYDATHLALNAESAGLMMQTGVDEWLWLG